MMKYFKDMSLFRTMQKVPGQTEEQPTEQLGSEMTSEIQCKENIQWGEKQ